MILFVVVDETAPTVVVAIGSTKDEIVNAMKVIALANPTKDYTIYKAIGTITAKPQLIYREL